MGFVHQDKEALASLQKSQPYPMRGISHRHGWLSRIGGAF
jgi:hypothetical protein